jgi:micrococcal nuclease
VSELDEAAERWSEPAAPPVAAAAPALAAFPATKAVKAVKAVKKAAKKAAAPAKKAAKKAVALAPWVEPTGGVCPTTHPVKAKLHSRIFHLPGMLNYGRVTPDRCYITAEAAAADDLRPSKR